MIKKKKLPFDLKDQVIYYTGPTPPRPNKIIGAAGPTTSGRMDKFTPKLLAAGLKGMIGKGRRSQEVIDSIKEHRALYFAAIGGAAAYISKCIKRADMIAYEDLGTEAVYRMEIEAFPVIVINDCDGNDYYKEVIMYSVY